MGDSFSAVRRVTSSDAEALRTIRLEALLDTPQAYGATYEELKDWPDERWEMICRRPNYFVAEYDGRVVGIVSGGRNEQFPGTRWLYGIYVTPFARGTGTAAQLVGAVEQWARGEGVNRLYLHVAEPVARARAFYERIGFRLTGETMVMDRDPSIRLLAMDKSLD